MQPGRCRKGAVVAFSPTHGTKRVMDDEASCRNFPGGLVFPADAGGYEDDADTLPLSEVSDMLTVGAAIWRHHYVAQRSNGSLRMFWACGGSLCAGCWHHRGTSPAANLVSCPDRGATVEPTSACNASNAL
jgi:hypothetical protein